MKHNERLIQIINELNKKEAEKKDKSSRKEQLISEINQIDELENNSISSYLNKFNEFKKNIDSNRDQKLINRVITEVENIENFDGENLDVYSKKDEKVFLNKAKKEHRDIMSNRTKLYANTKARIKSDNSLSPLRLKKFFS
jgi:hypothetical protein